MVTHADYGLKAEYVENYQARLSLSIMTSKSRFTSVTVGTRITWYRNTTVSPVCISSMMRSSTTP
jgi:hypothetical protein